jgi:hypothetical protein
MLISQTKPTETQNPISPKTSRSNATSSSNKKSILLSTRHYSYSNTIQLHGHQTEREGGRAYEAVIVDSENILLGNQEAEAPTGRVLERNAIDVVAVVKPNLTQNQLKTRNWSENQKEKSKKKFTKPYGG